MRFAQAIISKVLRMYRLHLVSCKVNGQVINLLWITAIKKAWQNSVGGTRTRCFPTVLASIKMMNNFLIRCARNIPICWRAWNINLHSGQSVLNHQVKSLLFPPKIFQQTVCRGLNIDHKQQENKRINSKTFINFEKKLKDTHYFEMTNFEWENLTKNIIKENPQVENYLDFVLMKTLKDKPDLSLSFFTYIKSKKEPDLSTLTQFFQNCAQKYDAKTWIVADRSPKFCTCHPLLKLSLKEQDFLTFYEVWTKVIQEDHKYNYRDITNSFFVFWEEGVIPTDLFFELLKLGGLPLDEYKVHKLKIYCESEWPYCKSALLTKVDPQSQICRSCEEVIPGLESVDESVMKKMFVETMRKALIGDNIFKKATLKELKMFSEFMKKEGPFDYIVDGLNLTHFDNRNKFPKQKLKMLHKEGKRVLVITKGFPREMRSYTGPIFRVSDGHKSSDDIYIMLAAFMSGPECYVVTNDDFGDHISIMDPDLRPFFEAWRNKQRVFFIPPTKFVYPDTCIFRVSETEKGWHVPFKLMDRNTGSLNSNTYLDMKSRWFLCVEKTCNYMPSSELVFFRQVTEDWKKKKVK
ncbi:uncharacterized protein LOC132716143 [Ruditapes philippinarum]|uniref:uncharacterized protein LOC132716143 n=1 Tax=Ruditapes philippinarum TaxID=129788 RepID=UPI00295B490A|nr:uncharacterized protein LOC132716143 [Ruditapes philippinarum]